VVAAHPDDEILGCGGTVARLVNDGYEAFSLVLGEGVTSRDEHRDRSGRMQEIVALKSEMERANRAIGVRSVFSYSFPDNRFDSVPILEVVKVIEEIKKQVLPSLVLTHHRNDLNVDHQVTYSATLAATRPMPGEVVRAVYSFEVLSSTEWNYPQTYCPSLFFDISATLERKIEALACYASEMREYPHPRSLDAVRLTAQAWGVRVGLLHAEAFEVVRELR
jgi:LmbE family N-acetylglucosaminyl deacetylase